MGQYHEVTSEDGVGAGGGHDQGLRNLFQEQRKATEWKTGKGQAPFFVCEEIKI